MTSEYIHVHGAGDFFLAESHWTTKERNAFKVIHYGFNDVRSQVLRDTIEACPQFANVEHRYLSYPSQLLPGIPNTFNEHGILHRKQFTGSSFVKHTLAPLPDGLPESYDFLQLYTPFNTAQVRAQREVKFKEWDAVIKRLEARETVGLVIDAQADGYVPIHPRILDYRGKTTLPVAIEILKNARGYLGIDSCFSVLAAQIFESKDLLIRTQNQSLVIEACSYYGPHDVVDFLTPVIGEKRHEPSTRRQPLEDSLLVELRCNALVGLRNHGLGDRVELPKKRATELIDLGKAVAFTLED